MLESAFNADKENFVNHPYFTSPDVFVGAGPFHVVAWVNRVEAAAHRFLQPVLANLLDHLE